jgi:hypothetical protein
VVRAVSVQSGACACKVAIAWWISKRAISCHHLYPDVIAIGK